MMHDMSRQSKFSAFTYYALHCKQQTLGEDALCVVIVSFLEIMIQLQQWV